MAPLRLRARPESGFTLVEVMFAAVVLAVATLGFSTAIIDGYRSAAGNRESEAATRAARDAIEDVRAFARSFGDDVIAEFDGAKREVPGLLFDERNRNALTVTVTKTDPLNPESRLIDVRVDVRWTGRGGSRDLTLVSRILGG